MVFAAENRYRCPLFCVHPCPPRLIRPQLSAPPVQRRNRSHRTLVRRPVLFRPLLRSLPAPKSRWSTPALLRAPHAASTHAESPTGALAGRPNLLALAAT